MGPSAAAEPLEEASLPQGGEGSPANAADAGEGHSTSIHKIQQVTTKNKKCKGSECLQRDDEMTSLNNI